MINTSQVKAIIFDIDGTLRDTDDEMIRSIELFLLRFEYFITSDKAKSMSRRFVMRMENPAQKALFYADKWGWDAFIHRFVVFVRKLFKPLKHNKNYLSIEGIQEMIPILARHYPLAVASAGDRDTVLAFLEHAGILSYFQVIATALTCPHTKPFADPLVWAAKEMAVLPENCLMVGDTTVDILAGKNAGTQTLGVLCGFGEMPELAALNPDLIVETTAELLNVLGLDVLELRNV